MGSGSTVRGWFSSLPTLPSTGSTLRQVPNTDNVHPVSVLRLFISFLLAAKYIYISFHYLTNR